MFGTLDTGMRSRGLEGPADQGRPHAPYPPIRLPGYVTTTVIVAHAEKIPVRLSRIRAVPWCCWGNRTRAAALFGTQRDRELRGQRRRNGISAPAPCKTFRADDDRGRRQNCAGSPARPRGLSLPAKPQKMHGKVAPAPNGELGMASFAGHRRPAGLRSAKSRSASRGTHLTVACVKGVS